MEISTSPEAELAVRFTQIRDSFCNKNNKQFAKAIGEYPSNTSAYCNGTKNANLKIIHKVARAFPQVDKAWLVFGEGEMLAVSNQEAGVNVDGMSEINRLMSIIETKDRQIASLIDRISLSK